MKWLDKILLQRSTIELGHLNEIWAKFNDKRLTAEQTKTALLEYKWKHHTDKAKLLLDFVDLLPETKEDNQIKK